MTTQAVFCRGLRQKPGASSYTLTRLSPAVFCLPNHPNDPTYPSENAQLKFSVGLTGLEIEGLLTQGSRPGRTGGGSVGGMYDMYCSDWSNGIQYQVFDTEFKPESG
jgi:hypothetical protein